ncbi:MAG: permease-like cell division protein FtsX [Halioglobus sp.]
MARGKHSHREGAIHSRTGFSDRYQAWLRHHRLSAADSLQRLLDKPWSSFLTWMVIAIAIALPVGMNVVLDNARSVSMNWDRPAQISVFLKSGQSLQAAQKLQLGLASREDIDDVVLVSSEQALAEFRLLSGFADLLDSLEKNPLPHLLIVSPEVNIKGVKLEQLQLQLQDVPEVDQAVLDMEWVQRLSTLMTLGKRTVFAVGCLLLLGVVLILGNTIRLAIENRRDEIVIVKLVGGSNAFVRRPFLYTGLWYGVGGGLFAAVLVSVSLWYLDAPAEALAELYQSDFEIHGLGFMGGLNLIVAGGLLGLAGAWAAVSRHLSAIEPR